MTTPLLLSTLEAAKRIGVPPYVFRRHFRRRLAPVRIGRGVYYPAEAVENVVAELLRENGIISRAESERDVLAVQPRRWSSSRR